MICVLELKSWSIWINSKKIWSSRKSLKNVYTQRILNILVFNLVEYRFIWVSRGKGDWRWEKRFDLEAFMLLLEIIFNPEVYWRILSRKSIWSKSALKCSPFYQSYRQGPFCCKHLYVLMNSNHMLVMNQTCKNVRKTSKTKTNNKPSNKLEKETVGKWKPGMFWGKIMFSGLRSENMRI